MRIVIDLIGAQTGSRFRGIGRYSVALVKSIIEQRAQHEIILIASKKLEDGLTHVQSLFSPYGANVKLKIFDVPANGNSDRWRNEASELLREDFIHGLNPDVTLITSVIEGYWEKAVTSIGRLESGAQTAAIFYDLIPLILQDQYLQDDATRRFYYEKSEHYKRAGLLLCISESSRLEAKDLLGMADWRLENISAATDSQTNTSPFTPQEADNFLRKLSIHKEYLFCAPGGFDPRKNIRKLLEAYSLLPKSIRRSHILVIASKLHPPNAVQISQWIQEFGIAKDEVVLTDYLEDSLLHVLYTKAKLFVFPSMHEGFGLPILEAMASGCPVIGSNATSIPEVIGIPEAMFDPTSSVAISRKISEALSNPAFYEKLIQNSHRQAEQFSWGRSGALALSAIERLHDANCNSPKARPQDHSLKFDSLMQEFFARHHLSADEADEIHACIAFNTESASESVISLVN